jgi:hypothetical protein
LEKEFKFEEENATENVKSLELDNNCKLTIGIAV